MSSPIDLLLASLLRGGSAPSPLTMGGGPIPASADFGGAGVAANTGQPITPMRPEDLIVSPDPTQPRDPNQRMEGFRRMLTDFNFSLGSGLAAASQNPRGQAQRTQAGMGAILQVPKVLQDQIDAQKLANAQKAQTQANFLATLGVQKQQANTAALGEQNQQARTAVDQQVADQNRANLIADNARADKAAQDKQAQQNAEDVAGVFIPGTKSDIKGLDGETQTVGQYRVLNPADGTYKIETRIIGPTAPPPRAETAKPLQDDDYLMKNGSIQRLSFKPEATPQRPGGTYIDAKTGQDVTDQVVKKAPAPVSPNMANNAETASYKYHSDKLLALAKPVDDAANRAQRLAENINLNTAQADTILAPELLTVTSGGLGSGLRINEAEISRVSGGRPMIAQIQAKVRAWLGTDQKTAINFGPEEKKAMSDIVALVNNKLTYKQQALSYFGDLNSQTSVTEQQRRTGLADLEKQLRAIDQGKVLEADPTGKLHIFDDAAKAAAFRKATGQ